jgi:hypothetical protein
MAAASDSRRSKTKRVKFSELSWIFSARIDPAPTSHQKMRRHEDARQHRGNRHSSKTNHLRDRHVTPARATRHDLADIGVDHNDFGADARAREKSERNQPASRWSERARESEDGVQQQQRHEDDAPPETIAPHPENNRAHEHAEKAGGDERGKLLQRKKVRLLQRRSDVSDDEDVVQIEKIPERYQRNEPPMKSPERKPFDAGCDGVGQTERCAIA